MEGVANDMTQVQSDLALLCDIRGCQACSASLALGPRPIVQFSTSSRILIIGQAPGARVHASGIAWDDASGKRLRDWTGLATDHFYDPEKVALVPMGFCYPGTGPSGDLPPRPECAPLWHERILALLPAHRLTLLVGTYAQKHYLKQPKGQTLTDTVRNFSACGHDLFPLPHPSWRSGVWMQRNLWFEGEVLPILRARVEAALREP